MLASGEKVHVTEEEKTTEIPSDDKLKSAYRRTALAIDILTEMYNKSGGVAPDLAPDYEGIQGMGLGSANVFGHRASS